jgi:hypothetical protein
MYIDLWARSINWAMNDDEKVGLHARNSDQAIKLKRIDLETD